MNKLTSRSERAWILLIQAILLLSIQWVLFFESGLLLLIPLTTHTHTHASPHTHTRPPPPLTPQLLEVFRSLQKEHESFKTTSADSEKKAQRKLEEMREVQSLDQGAKAHMEEAFQLSLEEKDEKINVMATQVGGVVSW